MQLPVYKFDELLEKTKVDIELTLSPAHIQHSEEEFTDPEVTETLLSINKNINKRCQAWDFEKAKLFKIKLPPSILGQG